jgi:peptidoglycan-associated lipoprotein
LSLLIILILSGCTKVAPQAPLNGGSNISDSDTLNSQTVTIDEENINQQGDGFNTPNSQYNSSSDGFHSLYFGFDNYTISSDMQQVLTYNTQRAKQMNGKLKIEGNCDEFGTDEYNYALGLKRAKAVKDAMVSEGINPSRIVIFSYGESNPVCNSMSDECYRRNRRVDFKLVR